MTAIDVASQPAAARRSVDVAPAALLVLGLSLLIARPILPAGLVRPPDWAVLPLDVWLNAAFDFLREDLGLVVVTRALGDGVAFLLDVVNAVLVGGRRGMQLPQPPWTVLAISVFMIGFALGRWRLALLAAGPLVWVALFGQWRFAMETLALILVAAPLSVAIGFALGAVAWRFTAFERVLSPMLNVVQCLPHFAYLIPVVVFFGVGRHAGAVATIVFATPPMARMALLGLRRVPQEIVEAGRMCGANRFQLMRAVRMPTVREDLLIGVNQVIMQCLAMVVIASFIGAPGLGHRLLQFLQGLRIGAAVEIGVSVVLIAVALDRLSKAWAQRRPMHDEIARPWARRQALPLVWAALCVAAVAASPLHEWADQPPRRGALSMAWFWDGVVSWMTVELADGTLAFRAFMLTRVLIPMRDAFLYVPFSAAFALAAALGWKIGGARSALVCVGYLAFIAVSGWWDRSAITAYMVTFAVFVAIGVGVPLAIWAARRDRRAAAVLTVCDTAQTFPSFIYLIPVIMLFQVNDVSAIGAITIYATVPMIRYSLEGLRSVPEHLSEAVQMAGATRRQRLVALDLPLALPHMLVGLNQTVNFALFMAMIAAFIGTQDLGQEMMRALSATDVGKGLVLGLCVASLGLFVDHLATRASAARRAALGV
ncbi:MAG: ABC transporter permease subunit [Rhodobacteraceae bacterium]|nr:MAG: ABC transporter permease subunit [Paracoccaceae bacterium]